MTLYEALTEAGFEGPVWDEFAREAARYALGVMEGWLCAGRIFGQLEDQLGIGMIPSAEELAELARPESSLREDLANMTVAVALHNFRRLGRQGNGWSPTGGASITTYLVHGSLRAFPNELRRIRNQRRRFASQDQAQWLCEAAERLADLRGVSLSSLTSDPASSVEWKSVVAEVTSQLTPKELQIVNALVWEDATHAEIAEATGASSARSIEGSIYRLVTRMRKARDQQREGKGA